MIAEKMYELGTKKSTIRTIFEYGRKRAAEVGEENIYDFSLGNPNVPAPEFIKQAIIEIFCGKKNLVLCMDIRLLPDQLMCVRYLQKASMTVSIRNFPARIFL